MNTVGLGVCVTGLYACPFLYNFLNTGTPFFLELVLRKQRREGVGDLSGDVKMYIWES